MRIAWVVPGFQGNDDEPGIPAITALAHALADVHDLDVFTVRFPPRDEHYRLGRVQVHGFGGTVQGRTLLVRRAASLRRWTRVLRAIVVGHHKARYDIIHGWWATESGMLAAAAGRLLGVPTVVSLAGGELAGVRVIGYGGRIRPLEWAQILLALHLATAIGVPSYDAQRRLLVRAPWLRRRLLSLPLGYDPAVFAAPTAGTPSSESPPRSQSPGPLLPDSSPTTMGDDQSPRLQSPRPCDPSAVEGHGHIICVASWTPVKGHDLLLDAVALLAKRHIPFHLTLIGERTAGQEAHAAVAARGLAGRVSHLGALSQPQVAALLTHAQVLALASWHEAECLAVVEALARGIPVVATQVGIALDLLTDPRLGACVSHRSSTHLADALQAQLQRAPDEPRTRRLRRDAVAHLTLPHVAERLQAAYAALAST